jgi:leader peptidase (prepilin peptidase) / N-methyltransferase
VDSSTLSRAIVALPFGLILGSFMTVAVDRIPNKESVAMPASRCPSCGVPILKRDNIPVASWLILRGRCRSCGARIPVEYPILELSTAALVVWAAVVYRDIWTAVLVACLLCIMPAVSLIDIRHRIIPNRIMYFCLIAFPVYIVVAWALGASLEPASAALGLVSFGGILLVVALVSRGMGLGDVKLAAVIGVALGALGMNYVGVAAGAAVLLGGIGGLTALALGRGRKSAIPFGPYLAAGAVVAGLWGQAVSDWYLRAIGAH